MNLQKGNIVSKTPRVQKRTCKECKHRDTRENMLDQPVGYFCDFACLLKYVGKKNTEKINKKQRAKRKAQKEAVKPKSKWLAELQARVNRYVRIRDINEGCISCDKNKHWQGQWHAGHYYSRGHSKALRFNLNNIHKQCSVCNNFHSGNIGEYTPRLIAKIGGAKFAELQAMKSDVRRYEIDWIKRAKRLAGLAIKREELKNETTSS